MQIRIEEEARPKVSNYNELKANQVNGTINLEVRRINSGRNHDGEDGKNENESSNLPRLTKTAVGSNSNIRRNAGGIGGGFLNKQPSKKIADEVII